MASRYILQVAERSSGTVVASWPPGLAEERDLVAEIVRRLNDRGFVQQADETAIERVLADVQAKGAGIFRTEAHVLAAVREALEAHTPVMVGEAPVRTAVEAALRAVKSYVQP